MKAVVYRKYGLPDVLQIEEIDKPIPKKNQVLVKIYATTVTPSDLMLRSGKFPLLFWIPVRILFGIVNPRSKIPGYELSGVIEEVGEDAKQFRKGDQVFGATMWRMSCSAEYISLPEKSALVIKPANMTFEEAAAFSDGACTALHFLQKGNIQSGQKVLIYGASGSVGTFAVQLAKYFGAEVTGVCSTTNLELVKSLGADKVIDYTKEDFSKSGESYDIIFDTVGKSSFSDCIRSLNDKGIYLSTLMKLSSRIRGVWISIRSNKTVKGGFSTSNSEDLNFLKGLIEAGEIKSVIDRRYPLEQIAEAHKYVGKGHKKGNVVITVVDSD
ncbi:MAG: NAD(P)-dependent alcohol dehydrogenase [Candidatus Kariarchaeaceae archaeon]